MPLPAILALSDGGHAVLTQRVATGGYRIVSPGELAGKVMKAEDLQKVWTGDFLLITRRFRGVGVEPTTYNYQ